MSNFEKLTQSFMNLFVDLKIGLSLPLRRLLATLTVCLLEGTPAHLTALAEALPDIETAQVAKEQRIRRFLSNSKLSARQLLPLYIYLLRPLLTSLPALILSMDRTYWTRRTCHINVLMVSVHFQGRAIPLFWIVFDRKGNSSLKDWKTVLAPVVTELQSHPCLASTPIIVAADREFASPRLSEWLKTSYQIDSVLRLKRSQYLKDQSNSIKLAELLQHFPRGATRFYRQITVTRASSFLLNVTIYWGEQYDEPLVVMTTSNEAELSVSQYRQRFGIEPMFKDHKSNGFDLEGTKVTDPNRIERLLIVVALAHVFCTSEGYRKELHGEAKKNGFMEALSVPSDCS